MTVTSRLLDMKCTTQVLLREVIVLLLHVPHPHSPCWPGGLTMWSSDRKPASLKRKTTAPSVPIVLQLKCSENHLSQKGEKADRCQLVHLGMSLTFSCMLMFRVAISGPWLWPTHLNVHKRLIYATAPDAFSKLSLDRDDAFWQEKRVAPEFCYVTHTVMYCLTLSLDEMPTFSWIYYGADKYKQLGACHLVTI